MYVTTFPKDMTHPARPGICLKSDVTSRTCLSSQYRWKRTHISMSRNILLRTPCPVSLALCLFACCHLPTFKITLKDLCSQSFYQLPISLLRPPLTRPQFAQELLSTFSTSIGEVALIPSTGGVFTIDIVHSGSSSNLNAVTQEGQATTQTSRLWDREAEGGFPGT